MDEHRGPADLVQPLDRTDVAVRAALQMRLGGRVAHYDDGVRVARGIREQIARIKIDTPGLMPDALTEIEYFWLTVGRAAERVYGPGNDPRVGDFLAGAHSMAPALEGGNWTEQRDAIWLILDTPGSNAEEKLLALRGFLRSVSN